MSASPLATSPSPFLRHGAGQPVRWLPWGEEAFRHARETDRPVLLDIGAVWCHWCHVMDRESYEDPETAALINERFVPVKVDRDESPDVDARYQRAVQALVGQGGWPLTGFLTPDGELFHGGTYFPPRDAYGRPSFRRVLREVARVWTEERDRVKAAAAAIGERLGAVLAGEAASGEPAPELLVGALEALAQVYDPRHGGFGGAPKFPNVGALAFLLDCALESGGVPKSAPGPGGREQADRGRAMLVHTLRAMSDGGIHDQLGGGFHRYATDARWIIPHFEKMAGDNGPLLEVYARAARGLVGAPGAADWAEAAGGVVAWVRDVAPELVEAGGFPASQDADIGLDDDGDYWTWTEDEVRQTLAAAGQEDAAEAAILRWGVRQPEAAMHLDPSRHVLFRAAPPEEVAGRVDRPADEVRTRLREAAGALKAARDARPRPRVDTSLYSGWVALVASGHLAAARHLGMGRAGADALRALERVWAEAWQPGRGLAHRLGDAGRATHLSDQAYVAQAFLDAFEASQDEPWLERAGAVLDVIQARFADASGALLDRPPDADAAVEWLRRPRVEIVDAPEPSPTAVAAMAFARLGALEDDPDAADTARRIVAAFAGSAPAFAPNAGTYFRALRWVLRPPTSVLVVEEALAADEAGPGGDASPAGAGPLLRAALRTYRPETVVRRLRPGDVGSRPHPEPLAAMVTGDAPRAYVCAGLSCAPPASDPAALEALLRDFGG